MSLDLGQWKSVPGSASLHLDNMKDGESHQKPDMLSEACTDPKQELFERFIFACSQLQRPESGCSDTSDDFLCHGRNRSVSAGVSDSTDLRCSESFLPSRNRRARSVPLEPPLLKTDSSSRSSTPTLMPSNSSAPSSLLTSTRQNRDNASTNGAFRAEAEIYTTQMVRTLTSGRSVWL